MFVLSSLLALLILTSSLGASPSETRAMTKRQIQAVRVTTPPVIDGKLEDACWKSLPSSDGFRDEQRGTPVQDDTTVWIGYDDKNIYVAFYCHDRQPRAIVARETKRGAGLNGEDLVDVLLDPFNSKHSEDTTDLKVNPLGTQSGTFAGGHADKQEWEGTWQSAARIVADGWTCEMAIPWHDLARPAATGKPTSLELNFRRYQARTQVWSDWSYLGPQFLQEYDGQWVGVVLPPETRANPFSILGYSFGGYDAGHTGGRSGMDMRYQFTPRLTGVASFNPDFSNIEKAITTLDFSYAEKLPDETRSFFLEGGDYYRFFMDGVRPFTSVRIPVFDVGSKFYGRIGSGTNLGILTAQTYAGRNDSVLTINQQFSPFTGVRVQAVHVRQPGVDNSVFALVSGYSRGNWNADFGCAHAADSAGPGNAANVDVFWNSKAWYTGAYAQWISPRFEARDGYVPFTNELGAGLNAGYWNEWRTGPIAQLGGGISVSRYIHNNGSLFNDGIGVNLDMRTRRQLAFSMFYSNGRFEQNHDHLYNLSVRYPALNKFHNFGLDFAFGTQGGGRYSSISPAINWRFFHRLSVAVSSQLVSLNGSQHQHVLSVNYDLSKDRAIGGRLVRRNGLMNWYLSYRCSGYGGTEYFIIWGDPNADAFKNRLVFKIVRPF